MTYKPHKPKKRKVFMDMFLSKDALLLLILVASGIILTIILLLLSVYT